MLSFQYTITLPDSLQRRRQLWCKLRQYEERQAGLERLIRDYRPSAPAETSTIPAGRNDQLNPSPLEWLLAEWRHYELRLAILTPLLHEHKVNLGQLQRRLRREGHLQESDEGSWFMATAIIIDYVLTGGKNLTNGTGLPDVKPPPGS